MMQVTPARLQGIAADLSTEVANLDRLATDIAAVRMEIDRDPGHATLFYENLGLKLHNFYTGCERIFQTIASELNGGQPAGFDWHRRLLERMGVEWQGRPALLSAASVDALREFLAFRHILRNIYGYELDQARIAQLIDRYPDVWQQVRAEIHRFIDWLESLADEMDQP